MVTLSISEIFKKTDDMKTTEEVVEYLRRVGNKPIQSVLKHAFDPSIKFLLPEGPVPYTPSPHVESQTLLYARAREFYLFIEGGNPNLKQTKREVLFIDLLESLDAQDAVLVAHMKDKTLPYKNITAEVAYLAFPDIFTEIPFKEVVEIETGPEEVVEENQEIVNNTENFSEEKVVDEPSVPVVVKKNKGGRPRKPVTKEDDKLNVEQA